MRVSYSEGYFVPLPPLHPFPMGKFPALYQLLLEERLITSSDVVEPREADWSDLLLVHARSYLSELASGALTKLAVRRMGLPWSQRLVYRSRLAVQGTINASMMALLDGIAANLAGGTHHAFPTHGEGFCVLNDVAVAIRVLQRSQWINRAMVVDLDVHQGNGTATIFAGSPDVFTLSMHGAKNYPFLKSESTLDVGLADGTSDDLYLSLLDDNLGEALEAFPPDILFYLAGIDVVMGDRFGRIALSREGLRARDAFVLTEAYRRGIPIVLLLSGGYASSPEHTADLHAVVHREAVRIFG